MTTLGVLAKASGVELPLQVLQSAAGFYLGTVDPAEGPYSRESREYWSEQDKADLALRSGNWTQRDHP